MFCQLKFKIKISICYAIMIAEIVGSSLFFYRSLSGTNIAAEMGWRYQWR